MPAAAINSPYVNSIPLQKSTRIYAHKKERFFIITNPITENKEQEAIYSEKKIQQNINTCPPNLIKIRERIETERKILTYKENWDDNGALPIPGFIFNRATTFLENYSNRIFDVCGKVLIEPDIMPVPDGSIDLEWNLENSSFLINFKNTKEDIAFYYGEFKDNDNIAFDTNGQINTGTVNDKFASYLSYLSKETDSY